MPQTCEFRLIDAAAHTAGVHEAAVGIVIGEQQGAEQRAPAFRVGPADDQEFLAIQAFDLEPQAAIAGPHRRVLR